MAFGDPNAMMGPAPMGPPPMDPMMGAPMEDPMMAPPGADVGMEQAMPSPDEMMMMLLEAVTQKWGQSESMVDMEKQMLVETLMQIAMPQPEVGPADFAEPGMGAPMPMADPQMGDQGMMY